MSICSYQADVSSTVSAMREQELALRDLIAKLKERLDAETAKSKEFGGRIKSTLEQLQEECSAHDETKVRHLNGTQTLRTKPFSMRYEICLCCFHPINDVFLARFK
jgi:hypothetical protein